MQSAKKTTGVSDALRAKAGLAFDSPVSSVLDAEAVKLGREPLPSRRSDFEALRAKVIQLYGIAGGGIPALEAEFKFSATAADAELNYLHVEPLLERAAELLTSCRAHKSKWAELQAEKWKLALEFDQFLHLVAVEDRERQAGGDTAAYEMAVLDRSAQQSLQDNKKAAEAQLKALLDDLIESGLNKRLAAREVSAWLSAYPLKDNDLRGDDAAYTFDGVRRSKPEHLYDAARKEADQDAWEQVFMLAAQIYAMAAEGEAARLRKERLDLQAQLYRAGITSLRERAQIARDVTWERVYQAQAAGGLFNYQEQAEFVRLPFKVEFREVMACLNAAARGLKELYDFALPLPEQASPGYFESVCSWTAQARNRLSQLSAADQNYTLAVSLKQLTGAHWEAGLASGQWTFDVPAEIFAGQSCVRLRGIDASVVTASNDADAPKSRAENQKSRAAAPEKATGFWSARLSLPAKGVLRNAAGSVKELDQHLVPTCYLGKVSDRDSARESEIAGVRVLHNASPIGTSWKLERFAQVYRRHADRGATGH